MKKMRWNEWMAPIWEGGLIWEEPVCFFETASGEIKGGQLLYAPGKLIRVMNHDGTIEYEEHKDYEITDTGIKLAAGSRIPILARDVYSNVYNNEADIAWCCLPGKERYIKIFGDVYKYQVLVTYETGSSDMYSAWDNVKPERKGHKLVNTYKKLEAGEPVHLVFYGDSITAGWEASGANEQSVDMTSLEPFMVSSSRYPYMPVWPELVTNQLRKTFPNVTITKDNLAAGGSTAQWGVEHVNELFDRVETPDLVFIGFGMNCMWDDKDVFIGYIDEIITALRKRNPDCEYVIYPAMTANSEIEAYCNQQNMPAYELALEEYASGYGSVIMAPIHSVFQEVENRGKQYYEITGNCVNHPNDFSVRLYAQIIWETMCKYLIN